MTSFYSDGLQFNDATRGLGRNAFFFQHGIGGALAQPLRFLLPPDGKELSLNQQSKIRAQQFLLAAFDFRAHGSTPLGDPAKVRLEVFAEDLVAFMDHLQIEIAVLGGISMGAAVALRTAFACPERCIALVLCRPAWLNGSMSAPAIAAYAEVVKLLRAEASPETALQKLEKSDIYRVILTHSPDAARSLLGQI